MDCPHPRTIRNPKSNKWMRVPCGRCIACRIAKTREWKLRLMMEKESWSKASFITLTYDEEHLPHTNCGRPTLWPEHLTDYWKRYRMQLHRWKYEHEEEYKKAYDRYRETGQVRPPLLRYYSCGEYGDSGHRPHYHAIVFGSDYTNKGNWWIHHYQNGKPVYTSDELLASWPYGLATIDEVTPQSCGYVCGYVQKKLYYDPWDYYRHFGCCVHPFSRQSQGLCLDYYEENKFDTWITHRFTLDGISYSTPRYLLKKDSVLKESMKVIGNRMNKIALAKEQKMINEGYDIYESMRQKEDNLIVRNRNTKGCL